MALKLQFRGEAMAIPRMFYDFGVTVLKEGETFDTTDTERLIVFCYDLASTIDFDALKAELLTLQRDHKIMLLGIGANQALHHHNIAKFNLLISETKVEGLRLKEALDPLVITAWIRKFVLNKEANKALEDAIRKLPADPLDLSDDSTTLRRAFVELQTFLNSSTETLDIISVKNLAAKLVDTLISEENVDRKISAIDSFQRQASHITYSRTLESDSNRATTFSMSRFISIVAIGTIAGALAGALVGTLAAIPLILISGGALLPAWTSMALMGAAAGATLGLVAGVTAAATVEIVRTTRSVHQDYSFFKDLTSPRNTAINRFVVAADGAIDKPAEKGAEQQPLLTAASL